MARWTYQVMDESRERSAVSGTSAVGSAANYDAQLAAFSTLRTEINSLILGSPQKYSYTPLEFVIGDPPPADPFAQREWKWLVTYIGAVSGKRFQIEIPTADPSNGHKVAGSDLADLTNADWVAFITAFEAFAKSPDNPAEAVTVESARLVGRNL
jgi:hypothetical protein